MSAFEPLTDEQRELRELVRQLEFPWDVVELFRENDILRCCSRRSTAAWAREPS
jgi:hypothetical protein